MWVYIESDGALLDIKKVELQDNKPAVVFTVTTGERVQYKCFSVQAARGVLGKVVDAVKQGNLWVSI